MRGKPYPAHIRSRAVAELVTGSTVPDVAARYDLPPATVRDWLLDARKSAFVRDPGVREARRDELIDLLTELVTESIRALVHQSRVAGRDSWIEGQGAADLAAYRGTELDRLIRILPAFQRVAAPEQRAIEGHAEDAAG